jgi:hypothetical protein
MILNNLKKKLLTIKYIIQVLGAYLFCESTTKFYNDFDHENLLLANVHVQIGT